jgi:signal transduction histidine kinase
VLEASGAENIQVDLALEPGLVVWVDRTWFPSVVDNVLENAIKYGRAPYRVTGGRKGESVVLEVEDRGPGVPPAELSRLFERFYRGTQNRLTKAGTGLGLSIARRIVEAHGGTIAAHLPEGGFAVRVVLPVRPPAPSAAVPEEPAALAAPEGEVP